MKENAHTLVLSRIGARLRRCREEKGWTQAELARRSGVSLRFCAEVERGGGNASVLRLAELCDALDVSLAAMVADAGPRVDEISRFASLPRTERLRRLAGGGRNSIALVGLRGAGKSSVGVKLAEALNLRFVEVDQAVEERAGLRLGAIFEYHGADRYRALEREVLASLLDGGETLVLATGGSVVTDTDTWGMLRRRSRTVWLRASPESHLRRVEDQGDLRPMRGRANALAELRGILAVREPLYALADRTVDTEAQGVEAVVEVLKAELAV